MLTDKLAPRYKQNPFGSNISRFNQAKKVTANPTDDELRVRELVRDLEEHTGITRETRPGVRTAKLMQQIHKKPVYKLMKEGKL